MGRWSYSNKTEADNLKKIQIWWLKKHGYFNAGWRSGTIKWTNGWTGQETSIGIEVNVFGSHNYIRLYYTQTDMNGDKKDFDYRISLTSTPCHFGSQRYWFICPLTVNGRYCGKRVGVLYKAGDYFGCRHCNNLTYESKNENRKSKLYSAFYILTAYRKIEHLEQQIKRKIYAGRPTRKKRRLNNLYKRTISYAALLK